MYPSARKWTGLAIEGLFIPCADIGPMNEVRPSSVLLIGRFQPFHKGHEKIISYLLRRYSNVTIVIGSAQEKRTKENPFSAVERKQMIRRLVNSHAGWGKRIKFANLADNRSNFAWVRAVCSRFPSSRFAIASANSLVRRLLKNADYRPDPSPLFRRAEWEGKRIRKKIRGKGKFKPEKGPSSFEKNIPLSLRSWMKKKGESILFSTSRP